MLNTKIIFLFFRSVRSSTWYFVIKSLGEEKKHHLKTATLASVFSFPVSRDTNCTDVLFLDVEFSSLRIIFQGYLWPLKCVCLMLLHCEWKTVGWRIPRLYSISIPEQASFAAYFTNG